MIGRNVGQDETDDLIVTSAAGEVAAFASDLSEHSDSSRSTPQLTLLCQVGNAEVVNESAWVQLCGPFAVEFRAGGSTISSLDVRVGCCWLPRTFSAAGGLTRDPDGGTVG